MKHALLTAVLILTACSSSSENDYSSIDGGTENGSPPVADAGNTSTSTPPSEDSEGDVPATGNPPASDTGNETRPTTDNSGADDPGSTPVQTLNAELYPASINRDTDAALLIPVPDNSEDVLPANARVVGDVNGDGIQDISVLRHKGSDPLIGGDDPDYFAAVLFGTANGDYPSVESLNGNNGFIIENVYGAIFDSGFSGGIWSAGDLNGDGYTDISYANSGFHELSSRRVLPGAASFSGRRASLDIDQSELLMKLTISPRTRMEFSGDINNDGFGDLLIGGQNGIAPAIVYGAHDIHIIAENIDQLPGSTFIDYCQGGFCFVSAIDDFDADGFDDILASRFGCGYSDYLSILYGSADGIATYSTLDEYPVGERTRVVSEAGSECSARAHLVDVGDIDGDGASDLLLSGPAYVNFGSDVDGRLIFGTPAVRPEAISVDDLDGAKGMQLSHLEENFDQAIFLQDRNEDGYDDIVYSNGRMFQGRPRDTQSIDDPVVRRAESSLTVFWAASESTDVAGYRLGINDRLVVEVGKDVTSAVMEDPANGEAATLVLETVDEDGNVLRRQVRRVPAYQPIENLSASLLAPRLVEISIEGGTGPLENISGSIKYYSRYLVWRNGLPIGRSINGAANYIDETVELGQSYTYFVTPDYLLNDTFDPVLLQRSPLLQRQSNVVEIQTPEF